MTSANGNWLIVAGYTAGLVLLGVLLARRRPDTVDYFLASRGSTWPVIGLALLASNLSSTALVGLAGGAYSIGICVYDYEWTAVLVLVFYCVFLLPAVISSGVFTMPEFLERRYDRRVRLLFAALTLFLNVFVDSAGVLYSGALVCQTLFPGWSLAWIVAILAGAAALYTTLGGLRAVLYTEVVQALVLMIGSPLIAYNALRDAGGWHAVMSRVAPAALSLIRPAGDPGVPWPGLLLGIPVLGFYYWCTNQTIVQRVLSARNLDQARWGTLFAGLLKLPALFLIVLPGICALVLFPHLPRADLVYPRLIMRALPRSLLGVVAAGFVAATMVSIGSTLNSASTLITMDVVKSFAPRLSDRQLVATGRASTAALLIIAVLWAPQLRHFPSLWQYLQAVLAYVVPPVVALFLVGRFWRGATAGAAAATMWIGSACGITLFLSNVVFRWSHWHFLYAAPVLLAIDTALLVGVSLARPVAATPRVDALVWRRTPRHERGRRPGAPAAWRDYRWQAAALLAITGAIVIAFR
ncbi:MAG TPA: sodium/solute symporter [Steroidobacteraceae bacterium]|nr:sodium/solute symporter [Steroidobacteraceae bacterium]